MVKRLNDKEIKEAIEYVEADLKHEGMYLTPEDKELIRSRMSGEISKEEFLKIAYERSITGLKGGE